MAIDIKHPVFEYSHKCGWNEDGSLTMCGSMAEAVGIHQEETSSSGLSCMYSTDLVKRSEFPVRVVYRNQHGGWGTALIYCPWCGAFIAQNPINGCTDDEYRVWFKSTADMGAK